MSEIKTATDETIQEAAELLCAGELVALPTETVYGLGANALDGQAVAKIFEAKQRPSFNPLIVHVLNLESAEKIATFDQRARAVAAQFWPGPLTMILPKKLSPPETLHVSSPPPAGGLGGEEKAGEQVSDLCSAGLPTLAIRVPAHPVAQKLLRACDLPIAAPSANLSGQPSATTPKHVAESLGEAAPFILAAGPCDVGLESTVLDLSEKDPVILRPGAITAEDLEPILGPVSYDDAHHDKPKSPGQLLKHYAPSIPVRLNAVDLQPGEALLGFGSTKFMGIQGGGSAADLPETQVKNLSESGDLVEAAANLFAMLRDLDQPSHGGIAVMAIPEDRLGHAINDRLKRAAEE